MTTAEIGIFGGSGFYELLPDVEEIDLDTPYGRPSAPLVFGTIAGRVINETTGPPTASCGTIKLADVLGHPVFKGGLGDKATGSVTVRTSDYPRGT